MKILSALAQFQRLRLFASIALCVWAATALSAQSLSPRIGSAIDNSAQVRLQGSLHPLAQPQFDAGRLSSATKIGGIGIYFSRSAAQQADLDALIAAQQDPTSPLYHQWLNPDQFAARFGLADSDLEQVKNWLQQQGFSVDSVARSRNMIRFSGTTGQVEQAFSTQMHAYNVNGERHFAPSTELSIPAALAPVVLAVRNLSDFRPRPMHTASAHPAFTSSTSGAVHFAPGDIAVAYDINSLYHSGINGAGQSVALMGQSAILTSDIENFQSASGLPTKDLTQVLVPGSGTSTRYSGDESESDIDLEWSGAVARGANILFVYVGDYTNDSVFDSIHYTIDQDLASIISISYGACETALDSSDLNTMEAWGAQAVAQGQTLIASSGDSGSTSCYGYTGKTDGGVTFTTAMDEALAVNYPASSAYVTAAGGTEISGTDDQIGAFWGPYSSSSPTTALAWIPEIAWNDDLLGGLSSSGGGVSALVSRPSWQAGTIGGNAIPAGSMRLVPDIALYSSPDYPGYLFCSSDSETGIDGACTNGFRDANNKYLTVAGGTSFAAPIFAGMVAIINQAKGYTTGQGLVNHTLYKMAADSTTYASAFHDVTSGNNDCTYAADCSGEIGYSAGSGYDEVTGLGSVDLANLVAAWAPPLSPVIPTLIGTTTTITPTSTTPALNVSDTFNITVTSADGTTTPTGSVKLSIDGGGTTYSDSGSTTTVSLSAGSTPGMATASYPATFTTSGTHQIIAEYAGTAALAASRGVAQVNVPISGSFTMAATSLSIAANSYGGTTITVTPSGAYRGSVDITPSSSTLSFCYSDTTAVVTSTSAVQAVMTIDLKLSDCGGSNAQQSSGMHLFRAAGGKASLARDSSSSIAAAAFSLAGIFLAGFIGWRRRPLRLLCGLVVLGLSSFALTACGGGSSSGGGGGGGGGGTQYTIALSGQDSTDSAISATTSFNLTVQ